MAKVSKKKSLYGVHPGVAMMQKWVAELKEKSGRTLDEWLELVRREGPAGDKERRRWLKDEHGLGTNSAWWITERASNNPDFGLADTDPDHYLKAAEGYVEAMFAGGKAGLRPIYDRLLELGLSMGDDVKACPCKTIVPLYRNHVFAEIKPSTRTRIDFGLALKDTKAQGRLIATGGLAKKERITHRIPITSLADIDGVVERWLRKAYDMDA